MIDPHEPVVLAGGVSMPRLGLGVFKAGSGEGTRNAVRWALEAGYRHLDTAAVYRNEVEVGEALRRFCDETGTLREAVFVTTKLWNEDHGYDAARRAFDASLDRLGLDVIDQFLLHWPVEALRHDSWRALGALLDEGRVRSVGVSNFTVRHLEALVETTDRLPATNQIELHPWLPQPELVGWCSARGIQTVAYSPLTKGRLLDHPVLTKVADQHRASPAQVLIRWSLDQGHVVIPKSSSRERIVENLAACELSLSDVDHRALAALADGTRTAWDPTPVP